MKALNSIKFYSETIRVQIYNLVLCGRHEIVQMGYADNILQIRMLHTKSALITTYTSFEKSI
jgi:hypothetical protein